MDSFETLMEITIITRDYQEYKPSIVNPEHRNECLTVFRKTITIPVSPTRLTWINDKGKMTLIERVIWDNDKTRYILIMEEDKDCIHYKYRGTALDVISKYIDAGWEIHTPKEEL